MLFDDVRSCVLIVATVLVTLLPCASPASTTDGVERYVRGNVVISPGDPRVRVVVPRSAQYVGTDRWVLFGIANCELFAFVQADSQKDVRRLYWVQFEGYIRSMPKLQHEYTSTRHAMFGGLDFYVDTWMESNAEARKAPNLKPLEAYIRSKGYAVPAGIRSGSDEQHIDALIRAAGYNMPNETMAVRLVHLTDSSKRKELMIIYTEDLTPTGFTSASLRESGSDHNEWPAIERALIRRAKEQVTVSDGLNDRSRRRDHLGKDATLR